jgi:nonsense-mediated mRNA decay protein 3
MDRILPPPAAKAVVLCCMCGVEIHQNPTNMCVSCLRENVDITENINRQLTIHSCRSCGRFLCPPWQTLALESKELMAVCLRKIAGLSKVKLIDAVWIWTEAHSMRLKIKLTIQKEVVNGAILQQAVVVDFTIRNQQCRNCEMSYAQGSWHAVVQVRQRVSHKRTFFFLEQLLLKNNAHSECIRIVVRRRRSLLSDIFCTFSYIVVTLQTFRDGMDFYFTDKNQANRFVDFLSTNVPTKVKYARKLVSADHRSNVGDFKHNYIVEIVPLCKVYEAS